MWHNATKIFFIGVGLYSIQLNALDNGAQYKSKKLKEVTQLNTKPDYLLRHVSPPLVTDEIDEDHILDYYVKSRAFDPEWQIERFRNMKGPQCALFIPQLFNHEKLSQMLPEYHNKVRSLTKQSFKELKLADDMRFDRAHQASYFINLFHDTYSMKKGFHLFSDEGIIKTIIFSKYLSGGWSQYSAVMYKFFDPKITHPRITEVFFMTEAPHMFALTISPLDATASAPTTNQPMRKCFLEQLSQLTTDAQPRQNADPLTRIFRHTAAVLLIKQMRKALGKTSPEELTEISRVQHILEEAIYKQTQRGMNSALIQVEQAVDRYLRTLAQEYERVLACD